MYNYEFTAYAGKHPFEKINEDFGTIYEYMYDNDIPFNYALGDIWDFIEKEYPYEVSLLTAARRDFVTSTREEIVAVIVMYMYFKNIAIEIVDTEEEYNEIGLMKYIRDIIAGAKIKNTK